MGGEQAGKPQRFPSVEGRSLDGRKLRFPADFATGLNVAAVAFHRHHQRDVDSWAADFAGLEREFRVTSWEVPTISGRWSPVRRFIDGGMASAIADARIRAHTVTVYGDTERMTRGLGLPDRHAIAVVLCDPSGHVHWLGRGARTAEAAEALRSAAAAQAGQGKA